MWLANSKTFNQHESGWGPLNMSASSGSLILSPPPVRLCTWTFLNVLSVWRDHFVPGLQAFVPCRLRNSPEHSWLFCSEAGNLVLLLLCPNQILKWILKMSRKHQGGGLGLLNVLTWNDHSTWRNKALMAFRMADWNVSQYWMSQLT